MMEEQNFRIYIKNLRMQNNLSITEAAKLAYMNRKTLSRLEDGNTKISIDNLIALSAVYKKDLIQKYNDYMHYVDDEIMEKMNIIENKLVDMEYNDLLDDLKIFEKFLNKNLYIIQYYNFIKGVYYLRSKEKNIDLAYKLFLEVLTTSNKNFNLDNYLNFKYSILEFRCLKEIAICFEIKKNEKKYQDIIYFCNKNVIPISNTYFSIKLNYIIIQLNKNKFLECINEIEDCICKMNKYSYRDYLPYFYYLKYQVYDKMNDKQNAAKSLDNAISACDLFNKLNLKKIIFKKHGI